MGSGGLVFVLGFGFGVLVCVFWVVGFFWGGVWGGAGGGGRAGR